MTISKLGKDEILYYYFGDKPLEYYEIFEKTICIPKLTRPTSVNSHSERIIPCSPIFVLKNTFHKLKVRLLVYCRRN